MVLVGLQHLQFIYKELEQGQQQLQPWTVAAGAIKGNTVTNQGNGYTAPPIISFNGGGNIDITANLTGTAVTSNTIINGGAANAFTSAPTILYQVVVDLWQLHVI